MRRFLYRDGFALIAGLPAKVLSSLRSQSCFGGVGTKVSRELAFRRLEKIGKLFVLNKLGCLLRRKLELALKPRPFLRGQFRHMRP